MPTLVPVQTRLAPSPASAAGAQGGAAPAGAPAPAPAVNLRIDSLVLHGFAPAEARRVSAAFEGELARLLTSSPISGYAAPAAVAGPAPSAPALRLSIAPAGGEAAGAASARALHARLRA
jgi:hypothetical protein